MIMVETTQCEESQEYKVKGKFFCKCGSILPGLKVHISTSDDTLDEFEVATQKRGQARHQSKESQEYHNAKHQNKNATR